MIAEIDEFSSNIGYRLVLGAHHVGLQLWSWIASTEWQSFLDVIRVLKVDNVTLTP